MLDLIKMKMKEKKITNVEPVLGTITDPKLPKEGVDPVLLWWTPTTNSTIPGGDDRGDGQGPEAPGGRLVFVEYRTEKDADVPIKLVHKMSQKQVIKEMGPYPLRHVKTLLEGLPWQHIIIFEKKTDKDAPNK